MCAIDVRSPRKNHVDNTRRRVRDGGLLCFHWAVRLCRSSGTCGTGRPPVRRGDGRRPSGASEPIMQTSIASEYPAKSPRAACPDRIVSVGTGVFRSRPPSHGRWHGMSLRRFTVAVYYRTRCHYLVPHRCRKTCRPQSCDARRGRAPQR